MGRVLLLLSLLCYASASSSFIAYTIDGCGHCDVLKVEWSRMVDMIASLHINDVTIARVDCVAGRVECNGIHSYPTLRYNGDDYIGAKDAQSLVTFVKRISGPAVRKERSDDMDPVVVMKGLCDVEIVQQFQSVAERLRHRMYFVRQDVEGPCVVEAMRQSVNETEVWDASRGSLQHWAQHQMVPILAPFDKFLHATSRASVAFLFYQPPLDSEANAEALKAMRNASQRVRYGRRSLLFALVDVTVWDGLRTGITRDYPQVVIVDHSKLNHHYPFRGADWDQLGPWIDLYLEGKVERTLVSAEEADGVLVSKNFQSQVVERGDDKDVLVLFGSKHCGSSVKFRPTWDALVETLRNDYPAARLEM